MLAPTHQNATIFSPLLCENLWVELDLFTQRWWGTHIVLSHTKSPYLGCNSKYQYTKSWQENHLLFSQTKFFAFPLSELKIPFCLKTDNFFIYEDIFNDQRHTLNLPALPNNWMLLPLRKKDLVLFLTSTIPFFFQWAI